MLLKGVAEVRFLAGPPDSWVHVNVATNVAANALTNAGSGFAHEPTHVHLPLRKRKPLLRRRRGRHLLQFPSLIPQHRRH